jgi:hypothetical protein
MVKQNQGERLIRALRRRPHTYMDMLRLGISISPWKRVVEQLGPEDRLVKLPDAKGRITWRVVRA